MIADYQPAPAPWKQRGERQVMGNAAHLGTWAEGRVSKPADEIGAERQLQGWVSGLGFV